MANSKATGISTITGKTVYIRHATEWDMVVLGERLTQRQKDSLTFSQPEVVVAAEEDEIIGFGILEKVENDVGCLVLKGAARRHEIGSFIVRHLLEYAPMKTIYAVSDRPGYFRKIGFSKAKTDLHKKFNSAKSFCRGNARPSSFVAYEKR